MKKALYCLRMKKIAGSYDPLFTKRSVNYRQCNLASRGLTENDKRDLIPKEYACLKRPLSTLDSLKRQISK